jgi:hypothetical protein
MSVNRPDVTDEDIGMRAFQIRKAKVVERAVERIRHAQKQDWPTLTSPEIEELEWVLGELWAYVARDDWDSLRFGMLSMVDIRTILKLGRELRKHSRNAVEVLTDVAQIVRQRG